MGKLSMQPSFLFVDDCFSEHTKISSLTGVLVPTEQYAALRGQFYDILHWSISPEKNIVNMSPPELHGNELLRGETDEKKIQVVEQVVRLVIQNKLAVCRTGYFITPEIKAYFKGDALLTSVIWANLLNCLLTYTNDTNIIPVVDGFEARHLFSQTVKSLDIMRWAGFDQHVSIANSEKILGEVFYADSKYSIFIQVADILSYLLHVADWSAAGKQMNPFKQNLLRFAEELAPVLINNNIRTLTLYQEQS